VLRWRRTSLCDTHLPAGESHAGERESGHRMAVRSGVATRKGVFMTAPGSYDTDVSDMLAVHRALTGALGAALRRRGRPRREARRIGSFCGT
jgi:hypothetical protein